jgi:iron complex outermembrane receptor protein
MKPSLRLLPLYAAIATTSVSAQNESNGDALLTLEEVIVTATRRETSLQETAVAVAAYNTEMLEQRNTDDLQDVARFTPGLTILGQSGRGGGAGGSVAIRGMGTDGQESQPSTGIYIDEVYYPSGYGNVLGLLDAGSVEVLRGPQGTLFGRNTIAGAIQYRSAAPTDDFSGFVTATAGNFDRTGLEGAVNIPVSDSFKMRLSGMHNEIEGYVDNLTDGDTEGDSETTALRIRADWDINERLSLKLKGESVEYEQEGRNNIIGAINPFSQFPFLAAFPQCLVAPQVCPPGQLPGPAPAEVAGIVPPAVDTTSFNQDLVLPFNSPDDYAIVGINDPDTFDFEFKIAQATLEFDLTDDISLKSISAYLEAETEYLQDFDQTLLPILETQTFGDLYAFSQELQISGTALDGAISFVGGLYYYDAKDEGNASQLVGIGNYPADDLLRQIQEFGMTRERLEEERFMELLSKLPYVADRAIGVIKRLFEGAGSSAVADFNPMQRYWRDGYAARLHTGMDYDSWLQHYGRSLLGLPPTPDL